MKKSSLSILIAEDEAIERESLCSTLLQHFESSMQIYTAKNGYEAIELYKEHFPNIVLMDINMPGINGLEAIAMMKEYQKESVFLILTSYDYFNYAQEAIRLGVEDFLLKPANPEQIINVVSKASAMVHTKRNEEEQASSLLKKYTEMRPMLESQCLYAILTRSNEFQLQEEMQHLNMNAKSGVCFVLRGSNDLDFMKLKGDLNDLGYVCLYSFMNQLHVFFLLSTAFLLPYDLELIEYIMAVHHLRDYELGIGRLQTKLENFYLSYHQAVHSLHLYQMLEPLKIIDQNGEQQMEMISQLPEISEELCQSFLHSDEAKFHKVVHEYATSLLSKDIDFICKEVEELLDTLVLALQQHLPQTIDRDALPLFSIKEEDKYQNVEVQLFYVLNSLFHPLYNTRLQQSNVLVKQAISYIQNNFRKPISLNDVAKELHVTPFYISKIIKQYNDKNFTDLVSGYRIEEAKQRLRDHQRVKEVAFSVGFQSQSYFAKMFKKIVGVTPSEYQNMFL